MSDDTLVSRSHSDSESSPERDDDSPPPPLRYRIRHLTRYSYGGEVVHSHQMLRLTPRPMPHQRTLSHSLFVTPQPAVRVDSTDAFGNPVTRLQLDRPHDFLAVDAQMVVEVH
ncbi:MAG: transglutaminase N-terminal domain-containing protein, partial [Pseudomonadota bacterium]